MSAIRLTELILNKCNEKIKDLHTQMEKGVSHEQYMKLCGRVAELRSQVSLCRETLNQIEGEDVDDL